MTDMTTSYVHGCEHPGCHEIGTPHRLLDPTWGWHTRYLCAAHADEKEPADG